MPDELAFEVVGVCGFRGGPRAGRLRKERGLPPLFANLELYVASSFEGKGDLDRLKVIDLVELGGGTVVSSCGLGDMPAPRSDSGGFHVAVHDYTLKTQRNEVRTSSTGCEWSNCFERSGPGLINISLPPMIHESNS
jgi:hypothetical protein